MRFPLANDRGSTNAGTGCVVTSITLVQPTATQTGTTVAREPLGPSALRAFSREWFRELESLVTGAPITGVDATTREVQLICADGDRVSPWVVEVAGGRVQRVRSALARDATTAVVHSVAVGWRMLGRRVQEFHRVDELVLEQLCDGVWSRHPIPPLDEAVVDLARPMGTGTVVWHERVIGSPIGTLFVSRRLAEGRLRIFDAATRPPAEPSGVGSDVEWSELMAARAHASVATTSCDTAPFRRFWRGPADETWRIRSLLAVGDLDEAERPGWLERDRTLLDTLRVLDALGAALHAGATWRHLLRRTANT
jgi:hypothetical protein